LNKKLVSAIMALVVTLGVGFTSVHADTASDTAKIQQTQTQRQDLENKVEIMDNQIETIMSKINDNKNSIAITQKDIKKAQVDIAKAQDAIKAEQILFDKRMRVMYMSGSSSYIEIVLGSKNVGDFVSRLEDLKKIINFDKAVISDFKTKKAAIDAKKVALDAKNTDLLSLKADNEKKLASLTKQKSEQNVLVAQLKAQESKYSAQLVKDKAIVAQQAAVAASQVALAKIRNAAPKIRKSVPSVKQVTQVAVSTASSSVVSRGGGASFSSNSVLAYASNFLGVPYVWGGTSPSGFDCSGFTQYVYAHFGVNLPRVSESQQNVGTLESRASLQPGDLVFFGSPAHHVGIYVGNGNMINAPHTGDVVKIQTLNSDFTYGRRVR
jgi:peptidoglycan DL-endopeptidase CwlO